MPPEVGFRLGKSGDTHQPRPQIPTWLVRASTYAKAAVIYCLVALLFYLCLITHSRPTVQLLSVDMLLRCFLTFHIHLVLRIRSLETPGLQWRLCCPGFGRVWLWKKRKFVMTYNTKFKGNNSFFWSNSNIDCWKNDPQRFKDIRGTDFVCI